MLNHSSSLMLEKPISFIPELFGLDKNRLTCLLLSAPNFLQNHLIPSLTSHSILKNVVKQLTMEYQLIENEEDLYVIVEKELKNKENNIAIICLGFERAQSISQKISKKQNKDNITIICLQKIIKTDTIKFKPKSTAQLAEQEMMRKKDERQVLLKEQNCIRIVKITKSIYLSSLDEISKQMIVKLYFTLKQIGNKKRGSFFQNKNLELLKNVHEANCQKMKEIFLILWFVEHCLKQEDEFMMSKQNFTYLISKINEKQVQKDLNELIQENNVVLRENIDHQVNKDVPQYLQNFQKKTIFQLVNRILSMGAFGRILHIRLILTNLNKICRSITPLQMKSSNIELMMKVSEKTLENMQMSKYVFNQCILFLKQEVQYEEKRQNYYVKFIFKHEKSHQHVIYKFKEKLRCLILPATIFKICAEKSHKNMCTVQVISQQQIPEQDKFQFSIMKWLQKSTQNKVNSQFEVFEKINHYDEALQGYIGVLEKIQDSTECSLFKYRDQQLNQNEELQINKGFTGADEKQQIVICFLLRRIAQCHLKINQYEPAYFYYEIFVRFCRMIKKAKYYELIEHDKSFNKVEILEERLQICLKMNKFCETIQIVKNQIKQELKKNELIYLGVMNKKLDGSFVKQQEQLYQIIFLVLKKYDAHLQYFKNGKKQSQMTEMYQDILQNIEQFLKHNIKSLPSKGRWKKLMIKMKMSKLFFYQNKSQIEKELDCIQKIKGQLTQMKQNTSFLYFTLCQRQAIILLDQKKSQFINVANELENLNHWTQDPFLFKLQTYEKKGHYYFQNAQYQDSQACFNSIIDQLNFADHRNGVYQIIIYINAIKAIGNIYKENNKEDISKSYYEEARKIFEITKKAYQKQQERQKSDKLKQKICEGEFSQMIRNSFEQSSSI